MTAQIALIIMGIIICLVIQFIKSKYKHLIKKGIKAEGTLINYDLVKIKNNNVKIPVIKFTANDNQTYTLQSADSFFSSYASLGTKVNVFYNPTDPKEFMIQGKKFKTLSVTILIGGIIFILSGIILLLNQFDIVHLFKK